MPTMSAINARLNSEKITIPKLQGIIEGSFRLYKPIDTFISLSKSMPKEMFQFPVQK